MRHALLTTQQHLPQLPTTSLAVGAQLFVFSARQWLAAAAAKHCPNQLLRPFYDRYDASPALPILDELMCHLSVSTVRPLALNCPCRADLGDDEAELLRALQSVQRGSRPDVLTHLDGFLAGPLRTTFTRIAEAYVAQLRAAGLSLTGRRYLSAVRGTTSNAPGGNHG